MSIDLAQADLRQSIARAAHHVDLDAPAIRQELRRRMRLPASSHGHLWRLAISSGEAARAVPTPTLLIQGASDTVVRRVRELVVIFACSMDKDRTNP